MVSITFPLSARHLLRAPREHRPHSITFHSYKPPPFQTLRLTTLTRQPASGPALDTHEALCTSRTSGYRVFGVTNTPELLKLPSEDSKRIHATCVKGNKHSEDSGAMFALGCMCGNILRQSEDIVDWLEEPRLEVVMFRVVRGFGKIAGVAVVGVILVGGACSDVRVPSWSV